MPKLALLVASLVLCAGCGGKVLEAPDDPPASSSDTADAPDPGPAPPASRPDDPFAPGDSWHGTYTCPQGLTNLELRIVSMNGDAIDDAAFLFDWTAGGVRGSFHLRGAFDRDTGRATFEPGAWIDDPNASGKSGSWYTVGLAGAADAQSYSGTVTGPGCGSFTLTKP